MAGGMVDDSVQGNTESYGGVAGRVYELVARAYGGSNGTACHSYEPHVITTAFHEMIQEANISLALSTELCASSVADRGTASAKISSVIPCSSSAPVTGKVFIDATYEGDLMELAGAPFALGREARGDWNESMGGTHPINPPCFNIDKRISPFNETTGKPLAMVCEGQTDDCAINGGVEGAGDGKV